MRPWRCLALVLAAACGAAPSAPGAEEPLPLVRLRPEPFSFAYVSGFMEPRQFVVRDPNAWQQTWAELWRNTMPRPPLPAIDFATEMIVVVALGAQPTGGYSVFIDSASARPDGVVVQVRAISPGSGCAVTSAITQPVDVARVPRRDGAVTFTQRKEIQECR